MKNKAFFRQIMMVLFSAIFLLGLAGCTTGKTSESGTKGEVTVPESINETEPSGSPATPVEVPSEYIDRYKADVIVYDMLIPNKALLIGETDVVCLLMLEGITTETVIPRESIARTEKTEVSGMVVVKIVDRTGKEISMTLTPEDAGKVEISK